MSTRAITVDLPASARRANQSQADRMSAMRQVLFTTVLLTILSGTVSAQAQTRQRLSSEQSNSVESTAAMRSRMVGPRVSNHADRQRSRPIAGTGTSTVSRTQAQATQAVWGNAPIIISREPTSPVAALKQVVDESNTPTAGAITQSATMTVNPSTTNKTSRIAASPRTTVAPSAYMVGVGDVLDIRLSNTPARESTLFTVLRNGAIEYPLLDKPLVVAGMRTDEIAKALSAEIKVIKAPRVSVTVRDYASHTILVTGLVDHPGKKILRREAMPLFALLAEASVRSEATSVIIVHKGKEGTPLSLKDEPSMATLVFAGDAIRIGGSVSPDQYVYVGGDVSAPGEKTFRTGMTLTQVLILAGANLSTTKMVKIARQNPSGRLSTVEYDVISISHGKTPDPQIVPGDRIEVKRVR